MCETLLEFQEGWGSLVWMFSGTTQCENNIETFTIINQITMLANKLSYYVSLISYVGYNPFQHNYLCYDSRHDHFNNNSQEFNSPFP